jgi:hypothetical protein
MLGSINMEKNDTMNEIEENSILIPDYYILNMDPPFWLERM